MIAEIRRLRLSAAQALATVVSGLKNEHPSEVDLRDAWHERLISSPDTCPEGWYLPPPHSDSQTNIGHTVPWSNEPIQPNELLILAGGNPDEIANLISGKRRFLSQTEPLKITEDLIFTIEPRLSGAHAPQAFFHVIVGFEQGSPVVITEFDPLFEVFGMEYLHS